MALSSGAGTIRRRSRKVFRAGPRVLEKAAPPSGPVLYTAELARMNPRTCSRSRRIWGSTPPTR